MIYQLAILSRSGSDTPVSTSRICALAYTMKGHMPPTVKGSKPSLSEPYSLHTTLLSETDLTVKEPSQDLLLLLFWLRISSGIHPIDPSPFTLPQKRNASLHVHATNTEYPTDLLNTGNTPTPSHHSSVWKTTHHKCFPHLLCFIRPPYTPKCLSIMFMRNHSQHSPAC